jgi:ABC-type dipeptide/oligopeptide/nickel transport system permease subunit
VSGEPVTRQLGDAIGVSVTLTALAALVAIVVMTALVARPFVRGLRGQSPGGRAGFAAVLAALPEFLIGSVLLLVVAVRLGWLPTSGWRDLSYAVLPAIALGIPAGAILAVVAGDALRDALTAPWRRSWTAAGFSPRTIALAVVRRAGSVVTGQLGIVIAGMFGSAATVEVVFGVPGLGRLAVDSALAQDVPVVQACVLVILIVGAVAGAAGALAQRALLGPAFTDGALESAPPREVPSGGRLILVLPAAVVISVALWGIWRDPFTVNLPARLLPPSAAHPMGTDALGRDLLARVAHGALHTAALAVGVTALVVVIALLVGVSARRGSTAADLVNALPTVVVALAAAATAGPGWASAVLAVAAVAWAPPAAHARALALEQRGCAHVTAARALGASPRHVLVRHILPAVVPPVLRNAFVRLPAIALALASLGYLGLGAQPPEPEWGLLLAEGMSNVERAPWVVAFPAAALVTLGFGAVVAANRMR